MRSAGQSCRRLTADADGGRWTLIRGRDEAFVCSRQWTIPGSYWQTHVTRHAEFRRKSTETGTEDETKGIRHPTSNESVYLYPILPPLAAAHSTNHHPGFQSPSSAAAVVCPPRRCRCACSSSPIFSGHAAAPRASGWRAPSFSLGRPAHAHRGWSAERARLQLKRRDDADGSNGRCAVR